MILFFPTSILLYVVPFASAFATIIYNGTNLGGNTDYFPGFDQFSLYCLFTLQSDTHTFFFKWRLKGVSL